jgi:hypothetical protein
MGTGMPDAPPLTPQVVESDVSIVRLHGLACFECGAVNRRLRAAGEVVVRGCSHVWPIRTCGCRQGEAARPASGTARKTPQAAGTAPGSGQRFEGAST